MIRACFISVFLSSGLLSAAMASPIYVYKEPDGSIRFTTKKPPADVKAQEFRGKSGSFARYSMGGVRRSGRLFITEYADHIKAAARTHNLDANLIRAVIHVESAFNPRAVSRKGAQGLMQLMPYTSKLLKVQQPFSPAQNIMGGSKFLANLLRRYRGNLKLALAAYNAGPGAVDDHGGIPPYSETVHYVQRVMSMYRRYSSAVNE